MIWIALIILIILLIASTGNKGNRNRQTKPYRIDHPHYITDDEREEWYEEFDEECAWDEEEGW